MPQGDKSSYSSKQKRKAEHIEEGYEKRGVGKKEAERRAWATVNKSSGGGSQTGPHDGAQAGAGQAWYSQTTRGFFTHTSYSLHTGTRLQTVVGTHSVTW